jgi:hypothetical protein
MAILQGSALEPEDKPCRGKKFSQNRSNFPRAGGPAGGLGHQRMGEFQAHQVITVGVGDPERAGAQIAGRLGKRARRSQRRAGYFQQNLRGERQRAANCDQGATRGDVQCGGKLEQVFAFFVPAADEDRYGDGETRPLAALCFSFYETLQTHPFTREMTLIPHLGGQTTRDRGIILGKKPGRFTAIPCKSAISVKSAAVIFPLLSPIRMGLTPNFEALRTARFFPFVLVACIFR